MQSQKRKNVNRDRRSQTESKSLEKRYQKGMKETGCYSCSIWYKAFLNVLMTSVVTIPLNKHSQWAVNGWNVLVHMKFLDIFSSDYILPQLSNLHQIFHWKKESVYKTFKILQRQQLYNYSDVPVEKLEEMKKYLEESHTYKITGLKRQSSA